jgi:hypothetical protein
MALTSLDSIESAARSRLHRYGPIAVPAADTKITTKRIDSRGHDNVNASTTGDGCQRRSKFDPFSPVEN